jgi:hypothetical protein
LKAIIANIRYQNRKIENRNWSRCAGLNQVAASAFGAGVNKPRVPAERAPVTVKV